MNKSIVIFAVFLISLAMGSLVRARQPRLVLFVTVDQLRGDMPWRFQDRFGHGGFRYLMEKGVAYTQTHYRHSTTFTATGHATFVPDLF